MWIILISLITGIVIGLLNFIPRKYLKYNLKFQQIGIILLLFSMGASIGSNKDLIKNLQYIGLKSIVYALAACIFSILVVYLISIKLFKEEH